MASTKSDRGEASGVAATFAQASSKLRAINPNAAKNSTLSGIAGVKDLASTAVAYAKQETVAPLKGLGRYVGWALISTVFLSTGLMLAGLGALRGIQALTGADDAKRGGLDNTLSWVPYVAAFGVCLLLIGLVVFAAMRATRSTNSSGDSR